jgi:hypothetical protein
MKTFAALTLSLLLVAGSAFADTPKNADSPAPAKAAKPKAAKKAEKTDASFAAELEELRQTLQSQQEQLQLLKEELAKRDRQIDEAREAAAAANARAAEASSKAVEASSKATEAVNTTAEVKTTTASLKSSTEAVRATVATAQAEAKKAEEAGPTTIRYKGVSLTPGGFLAAETVFRNRTTSADIPTPFTGIPFPGNALSKVTETNFSGRQSRFSLLGETTIGDFKVTGYYEADFFGVGTASNNRQSNSYVLRQRQVWGQVASPGGSSFTGGQMWTLATENRKGIVNRGEAIPLTIDVNYNVGFTFVRQYAARFVKDFGGKFALGASVEGPQATFGGRGFSTFTPATGTASQNFFINAIGSGGGLFNAFDATGYSINKAPDVLVKAAFDPGFGHYEVFGIVSFFRNRVYPCAVISFTPTGTVITAANGTTTTFTGPPITCAALAAGESPSAAGAFNDSRTGGGGGVSFRVPLFNKKLDFGAKGVAGDGIARYAAAQLPDLTFRPDGTQALLRTAHGLGIIEYHPSPKLDVYAYYGAEYAWRAAYTGYTSVRITTTSISNPNGVAGSPNLLNTTVARAANGIGGYGSPFANNSLCSTEASPTGPSAPNLGNCAGDIRVIQEGTLGFWHKFYQGPKGGLRWGIQYSYVTKSGWSGNNLNVGTGVAGPSVAPKANDNMVFTSFRYYLP